MFTLYPSTHVIAVQSSFLLVKDAEQGPGPPARVVHGEESKHPGGAPLVVSEFF